MERRVVNRRHGDTTREEEECQSSLALVLGGEVHRGRRRLCLVLRGARHDAIAQNRNCRSADYLGRRGIRACRPAQAAQRVFELLVGVLVGRQVLLHSRSAGVSRVADHIGAAGVDAQLEEALPAPVGSVRSDHLDPLGEAGILARERVLW